MELYHILNGDNIYISYPYKPPESSMLINFTPLKGIMHCLLYCIGYNRGEYNKGEYFRGEYIRGEYIRGEYNRGEYFRGEYIKGEYI